VDLEYEAYLADFGIARMVDPTTSLDLSSIVGSVGYIPPSEELDLSIHGYAYYDLWNFWRCRVGQSLF